MMIHLETVREACGSSAGPRNFPLFI